MQRLRAEDFQSRYSKAEADRLLALLVEVRSSGLGWRPTGGRMPLLAWQRQRLDAAIRRVEEIRSRYP
jgi:hypothetical protein